MSAQSHINLLGKKARDRVTGFTGIVSSVSFDLYGCICAAITPPVDNEGKPRDGHWYDIHRVEIVDDDRVMPVPEFAKSAPTKATFGKTPGTHTHGPAEKPGAIR
jgi:hypothetical protein